MEYGAFTEQLFIQAGKEFESIFYGEDKMLVSTHLNISEIAEVK